MSASEGVSLNEITISGSSKKESETALLTEQKKAVEIKQSIGADELTRKGISNAATAITKISGISKEGSSNVYVRGLGDRYLNTSLNGLTMPSNNVSKKNIDLNILSTIDNWILSRLQETKIQVNKHIGDYRLDLMAQTLYEFVWGDYCDWYLELSKTIDNEADKKSNEIVLIKVLQEILKLLHPIIPFITEEISQSLFDEKLVHASYPKIEEDLINNTVQEEILWLQSFVLGIRQIRGEMNISPKKELNCFVDNVSDKDELLLEKYKKTLCQIVNLNDINKKSEEKEYATTLVASMNVLVPLAGLVDIEQEVKRLSKEIKKLEKFKKQLSGKLNNDKFMNSAPTEIIEKEQQKFTQTQESVAKLMQQLDTIKNT
jgi:valyl-tRNA synthetase